MARGPRPARCSARTGLPPDPSNCPNQTLKDVATILQKATVFRFDGSDSMPAKVGAGSFWTEMVKWQSARRTGPALANIDNSWPAS